MPAAAMRLLFLTHQYFPRHIGGTEMLVRGLVTRMTALGHEVTVITHVESFSDQLHDFGFRVAQFDGVPLWELHASLSCAPHPAEAEFSNPMLAELVARAARELRPDVIHAAHLMKLGGAVALRLKRDGFPVVMTLSDFWPLCLRHTLMKPDGSVCQTGPDHPQRCLVCAQATHGFGRPLSACANETELWAAARRAAAEPPGGTDSAFRRDVLALARRRDSLRDALLGTDRIIALSDHLRDVFIRHGYPPGRIETMEHGIETAPLEAARSRRQGAGFPAGVPRKIVFMGTLLPHKGAHILIEAMRRSQHARVRLELFGPSGSNPGYEAGLRGLAAGDPRIIFRGVLPPERLGEAFADAAALAMPAQWFENDPLVVKAALWCGVPVAASRLGSLVSRIDRPENGWLLPPSDVSAWAEWIGRVAREPVRTAVPVPAPASADEFAGRMLRVYESLLP